MLKKIFPVLFALSAIAASVHADNRNKAAHPASQGKITPCAPGVIYIQFKAGSTIIPRITSKGAIAQSSGASAFQTALSKLGLRSILPFDPAPKKDSISRAFGIERIYCMYYSNTNIDPHTAIAMLVASGEVVCGSVRYLFPISYTPNDPLIAEEYALTKMNVFNAWNTTTGDTSIVIADVDCAINIDHEDLKNEIKYNWGEIGTDAHGNPKQSNGIDDDSDGYIDNYEGWDFVGDVDAESGATFQPNNDPRPRNDGAPYASHGTHTAGCILATGNNKVGIAGVAYGCRLLPIKAAGADNADIVASNEGIHYASTHGARIINCSFGGLVANTDTALENIFLLEAKARGALVVAAAGNGINDNSQAADNDVNSEYPANGPYVLSVGATDQNDNAASFSNYGHSVSVWAPGVGIMSCDYEGSVSDSNSLYSEEDGTSFACPLTAGAAALLWTIHPDWLPEFISKQLIATCDNVVNPSNRTDYWGRINVGNALGAPLGPGLIISSYTLDGVASDSLRQGSSHNLKVIFENVMGAGTNLSATPISSIGAILPKTVASLGSMGESVTSTGDFQITSTDVFCSGNLPVQFAVTDGASYSDTLTLYIPLSVVPGFVIERSGSSGESIKRVSNTVAWAAFGDLDQTTNAVLLAQYALESDGLWQDTTTLSDGTTAPYDVEALDSLTAYFGTGQSSAGSVIYTTDGGQTFSSTDVSSFTPFVDGIHFFDQMNGILIGDPKSGSSKWGIGVTTDGGQSWNPLAKPISATGSIAGWNNSIEWVGKNGWFGTNAEKILRTIDGGVTWTAVKTTYQNSLGVAFADDAAHGIACFQPVLSSATNTTTGQNGIMTTTDSGSSWTALTTLPAAGITPGLVQFVPNTNTAILTSNMGIYRTTDFGATWTPIGIPVTFTPDGADISISRGNGKFIVSIISQSNGVATYSDALANDTIAGNQGVSESASSSLSFDINPNPSQSGTTISFVLPQSDRVRIGLCDPMGRNLETVIDELRPAGTNEVALDERNLPYGTYYAIFETASGLHLTRAITVLR